MEVMSEFIARHQNIAEYRFTEDSRYKDATHLLDSAKLIKLRINLIPENERGSEDKFEAAKQQLLGKMVIRQLSKCIGRGALTYGTLMALPTETLDIPKICLSGRIPPKETKIAFEIKDEAKEKELMGWPEFHNGVAAGLRLAKERNRKSRNTKNWILYQKPHTPKFEHGGFLLAMGLLGDLDCFLSTDIYQYLKAAHEATTIGVLIGSAASKLGTMEDSLSRTLCLHIPFLLPPSFEIDISVPIQSAAMLGVGLLYIGTSHRLITEMILSQIGRKPLSDKCMDREVYSLCAGFALGFVNMNYKEKAIGLSDLQLDDRLVRLVEGGKVMDPPLSMLSANIHADMSKCSSVLEGDNVNIHITAPGALMALAIIHMQTNNEMIARRLEIPSSFYALEQAKPFHSCLKILAKSLIMWNSIECTTAWIYSNIPPLIRQIFESPLKVVQAKYAGTLIADEEIDYSSISLCYVSILAGSILSFGLRYAGSNNKEAMGIICKEIEKLRALPTITLKDQNYVSYNDQNKNYIDKYTLDNCLCICAFSISIIMAGSGDVDCFRTLRVIRKHLEKDMNYGHNVAINMCLGFLFLGSGAYTFGNSKLAIAALLCSVYPYFATGNHRNIFAYFQKKRVCEAKGSQRGAFTKIGPADNKYHLQAMRHFYVLALQTRLLQAKDVDTGESAQVQMFFQWSHHKDIMQLTTPAIINQMEKLTSVIVRDPRYYEIEIPALSQWVVYVKKRLYALYAHLFSPGYALILFMKQSSRYRESDVKKKQAPAQGPDTYHQRQKIILGKLQDDQVLDMAFWKTITNNGQILFYLENLCFSFSLASLMQNLESCLLSSAHALSIVDNAIITPGECKAAKQAAKEILKSSEAQRKMNAKQKGRLLGLIIDCFSGGKLEILPMCWWLQYNAENMGKARPQFLKEFKIIWQYFNELTKDSVSPFFVSDSRTPSKSCEYLLLSHLFLSEIKGEIEAKLKGESGSPEKGFLSGHFATYFDMPYLALLKAQEPQVVALCKRIIGSVDAEKLRGIIANTVEILKTNSHENWGMMIGKRTVAGIKFKESKIIASEIMKLLYSAFPKLGQDSINACAQSLLEQIKI